MEYVNGISLDKLQKSIEQDGYIASNATVLELIKYTRWYLFFSRCDSQIRGDIADSEDMGAGHEYLDIAINKAMHEQEISEPTHLR
jgi:hypothetical protein